KVLDVCQERRPRTRQPRYDPTQGHEADVDRRVVRMRKMLAMLAVAAAGASALMAAPAARAELKTGEPAPEFSAPASLAGKPFRFSLSEALKKGPVVLYFYPKAFTQGCTIEA